jgi:hypothetical protein
MAPASAFVVERPQTLFDTLSKATKLYRLRKPHMSTAEIAEALGLQQGVRPFPECFLYNWEGYSSLVAVHTKEGELAVFLLYTPEFHQRICAIADPA